MRTMSTSPDTPRQVQVATNYGMAGFRGDTDTAADLGIPFDPELRDRQFASGQRVAELLSANHVVENAPEPNVHIDEKPRDFGNWVGHAPDQKDTNLSGIAVVRAELAASKARRGN